MSDLKSRIAATHFSHAAVGANGGLIECMCGLGDLTLSEHAAHVSAAIVEKLTKARTITTTEQVDALPEFSVLRDKVGTIWEREAHGSPNTPWWQTGDERNRSAGWVKLPAIVLWTPEDVR